MDCSARMHLQHRAATASPSGHVVKQRPAAAPQATYLPLPGEELAGAVGERDQQRPRVARQVIRVRARLHKPHTSRFQRLVQGCVTALLHAHSHAGTAPAKRLHAQNVVTSIRSLNTS